MHAGSLGAEERGNSGRWEMEGSHAEAPVGIYQDSGEDYEAERRGQDFRGVFFGFVCVACPQAAKMGSLYSSDMHANFNDSLQKSRFALRLMLRC